MMSLSHLTGRRIFALAACLPLTLATATAQTSETSSACTLKDHIYTCNKAAFQAALAGAKTASVETHSVDGLAQAQLTALIAKKLGKTVEPDGSPAGLIFLLIPVGVEGMSMSPGQVDVGTLRVYSANPDGSRAHLLWAEDFFGQEDMPWPTVVHSLILQFQSHFHIK